MNRIAGRAWVVVFLAALLLGGFTFFLCEYAAEAGEWVVFSGSPHVYNGENINCGLITDRDDTILLDMTDSRIYSDDPALRTATVHWVGDRVGSVYAPALSYYSKQISGFDYLNGVYAYADQSAVTKLNLSADVQKIAKEALGDYKGTVAVYNYKTGELICAVTSPSFDPDNIPDISEDNGQLEGMYLNRFTQSTYTPGSIFKIVTAAAALEVIPDVTEQSFTCTGSYLIDGEKITCEGIHGTQNMKEAFCNSCNCAFAQIAQQLGGETLEQYIDQFGVTDSLSFDGIKTAEGRFEATDMAQINLAWSAIGQYNDQINPAAFMSFVGAIANDGVRTDPSLVNTISVGNSVTYESKVKAEDRIMSATTAKTLQEFMANNVSVKYGSDNFPGLTVCAKTGTAEVEGQRPNAMLAGFCADDKYPLAFIVCVEDAGYGRTVCVPIASKVLLECKNVLK